MIFHILNRKNQRSIELPTEGEKEYKSLRDYTDDELIAYLDKNMTTDLSKMSGLVSEILRRMNERNSLLPKKEEIDWANPITP